tara:strand:- start:204 stop:500 length:297 start_codon:yes stop_codon:yes gene_type:complete
MASDMKVSSDAKALMAYQNRSKSTGLSYVLWFFLGSFGIHRFYLGSTGIGILILLCTLLGFVVVFTFFVTAIILIYDLFTLPTQVRKYNERVMVEVGG